MVQFEARKGAIKKHDNALDLHNRIDEFCVWIMCHFYLKKTEKETILRHTLLYFTAAVKLL